MKKICIVFLGNIFHDSRSFKMYKSLMETGYEMYVICSHEPGERKLNEPNIFYVELSSWNRAFFKIIQFYFKSLPLVFRIDPQVVIASDLFSLPLAWFISIRSKTKLIYDSRELYSSLTSLSARNTAQKLLIKLEKIFSSNANAIITVNQSIANFLLEKFYNKNILVLRNLPELKNAADPYIIKSEPLDVLFLYLGNFHPGRGFSRYFELIKRLNDEMINTKLLLIGKGELKGQIENEIKLRNLENKVSILGPYSPGQAILVPNAAKVIGLCLVEPLSLSYFYSLPNKIFEYIWHGIPFIASDFPEIKRVVEKYEVGLLADPQNMDEIHKTAKLLIEDDNLYNKLKKNCKIALVELNWENEIEKFYEILESL